MLSDLETIGAMMTDPWLVMGDFNCIANLNERIGQKPRLHKIKPLRNCMGNYGIHDLKNTRRFYT